MSESSKVRGGIKHKAHFKGMYGEIRKVRIGSIIHGTFRDYLDKTKHSVNLSWFKKNYTNYDWKGLRESFDEHGYDTDRFGYVTVVECDKCESERYTARDGNHRLHLLKEEFGDEHFILVKVVKSHSIPALRCGWCDKVSEMTTKMSGKLELTNVVVVSAAFLLLYVKPTLIFMGIILGVILVSGITGVFDVKKETYDRYGSKYGGIVGKLINILTNMPMIIIAMSSIYYVWYLINMNLYAFILIVLFTLTMGYLIGHYEKKEENGRNGG